MSAEQLLTSGLQQGASSVMTGVSNFGQYMLLPPAPNPLAQAPGMNTVQYSVNNLTQQVNPLMLQMQNAIGWYTPPAGVSRQQYTQAIQQQAQLDRDRYTLQMMRNPTAPLDALGMVGGAAWSLELGVPALSKVGAIASTAAVGKLYMADMLIGGAARALHRGYLGMTTEGPADAMDILMGTGRLGELQKDKFRRIGIDELAETSGVLPGLFRMGMNQTIFKRPADFVQRTAFKDIVSKSSHLMTAANPGVIGGRGFSEEQYGEVYRELKNITRDTPGVKFEDVINQFGHNMQSGEYSNASDLQDFKRRVQNIKSELKYLKEVGKVTGESAADLRNEMQRLKRELGVSGPDAFAAYKLGSQPLGAISGVGTSGIQMGGVQGAQLFKSQGFDADYGYISGQRMTALAGMTRQRGGSMSDQQWDNIGGVHGFAGAMMQNSAQLLSSNVGTTLIAGLATKDASGRMSIDPVKLRRLQEGKLPLQEILSQGSQLLTSEGTVGGNRLKVLANIDELAKGMPAEEPLMFAIKAMEEQVYLAAPELRGAKDEASRKAIAMGVSEAARTQLGVNFNTQQAMAYLDLSRDRMKYVEEQQRYLRVQQQRNKAAANISPMQKDAERLFGKLGITYNKAIGLQEFSYSDFDETPQEKLAKDVSMGGAAISALATFGLATVGTGINPLSLAAIKPLAIAAVAAYAGSSIVDSVANTLNPQQQLINEVRASQKESFIRQQAFAMEYRAWDKVPYSLGAATNPNLLQRFGALFSGKNVDSTAWGLQQQAIQRGMWGGNAVITPVAPTWAEAAASGELYSKDEDTLRYIASRNLVPDAMSVAGNTAMISMGVAGAAKLALIAKAGLLSGGTLLPAAALIGGAYLLGTEVLPRVVNMMRSPELAHIGRRFQNIFNLGRLSGEDLRDIRAGNLVKAAQESLGAGVLEGERGFKSDRAKAAADNNPLDLYVNLGNKEARAIMSYKHGRNIFIENAFDTSKVTDVLKTDKALDAGLTDVEAMFMRGTEETPSTMFNLPERLRQVVSDDAFPAQSGLAELVLSKDFGKAGDAAAKAIIPGLGLNKAQTAKRMSEIIKDPTLSPQERQRKLLAQLKKEVVDNMSAADADKILSNIDEQRRKAAGIKVDYRVQAELALAKEGVVAPPRPATTDDMGSEAAADYYNYQRQLSNKMAELEKAAPQPVIDPRSFEVDRQKMRIGLEAFTKLKGSTPLKDYSEQDLMRMFNEVGLSSLKELGLSDADLAPLVSEMRQDAASFGSFFDTDIFSARIAEDFLYGGNRRPDEINVTAAGRVANAIADTLDVGKAKIGKAKFAEAIKTSALTSSATMSALFDYGKQMQDYQKKVAAIDPTLSKEDKAAERSLLFSEFLSNTKGLRDTLQIDSDFMDQDTLDKVSSGLDSGLTDMETFSKYQIVGSTYTALESRTEEFHGQLRQLVKDPKQLRDITKKLDNIKDIAKAKGTFETGPQATIGTLSTGIQQVINEVMHTSNNSKEQQKLLTVMMTQFGVEDADKYVKEAARRGTTKGLSDVMVRSLIEDAEKDAKITAEMNKGGQPTSAPMSQDVLENLQRAIDGLSGVKSYFAEHLNKNPSAPAIPGGPPPTGAPGSPPTMAAAGG